MQRRSSPQIRRKGGSDEVAVASWWYASLPSTHHLQAQDCAATLRLREVRVSSGSCHGRLAWTAYSRTADVAACRLTCAAIFRRFVAALSVDRRRPSCELATANTV